MLGHRKHHHFDSAALITTVVLAAGIGPAQDFPAAVPSALTGAPPTRLSRFSDLPPLSSTGMSDAVTAVSAGGPAAGQPVQSGPRPVTLQQVQQQSANRAVSPLAYMSHLSVEAAKEHRLAVEADYFPKFGATFLNLHTTDFLGQIVQARRPFVGVTTQVPVQVVNQNMRVAALTMVQPITPLFEVRQAVRIARADERIALAKATVSVLKNAHDTEVEETYFKLLIAQRRLTSAEWKLRSGETRPLYASVSADALRVSGDDAGATEASKAVETAATVKELTASLNRFMEWPEDAELELVVPEPLVENISLQEVSDKAPAANLALVEAEETVVKARAAHSISKMEYFPAVVAVSGYLFQNTLPAVNSNFGYGGVMASYTLFDFRQARTYCEGGACAARDGRNSTPVDQGQAGVRREKVIFRPGTLTSAESGDAENRLVRGFANEGQLDFRQPRSKGGAGRFGSGDDRG
jgi:hypothetical protein